jgi:hypothetical protein
MGLKSLALVLAIISMALACSNCVSDQSSSPAQPRASSPTPAIVLTEQQKTKAISLAQNDTVVDYKINELDRDPHGGFGNFTKYSERQVKDVVMSSFTDTAPGGNNATRVMPAVVFAVGNGSLDGVNVHAFVDLENERVAYVGYVYRPGPANGKFNYSASDGGMRAYFRLDSFYEFFNATILDTGYLYHINQSEQEMLRPEIINITLDDPGVKDKLEGHSYYVKGIKDYGRETPTYWFYCPVVMIVVNDERIAPVYGIEASVNLKTKKVMGYFTCEPEFGKHIYLLENHLLPSD